MPKQRMTIAETLTTQQKIDMYNGNAVGIFTTLLLPTDLFFKESAGLCLQYYTTRGGKPISETYKEIIEFVDDNVEVIDTAENILSSLIRTKFTDKWNRVYKSLVETEYNVLDDYNKKNKKTGNNSNTYIYDNKLERSGQNIDKTEHNVTIEDETKTATKEVTENRNNDTDSYYGFNSESKTSVSGKDEVSTETLVGSLDDNVSKNKNLKTGSETVTKSLGENNHKSGTDSDNHKIDETEETSGRNTSGSDLLKKELNFRDSKIFYDIVFRDIDSIATLSIYI